MSSGSIQSLAFSCTRLRSLSTSVSNLSLRLLLHKPSGLWEQGPTPRAPRCLVIPQLVQFHGCLGDRRFLAWCARLAWAPALMQHSMASDERMGATELTLIPSGQQIGPHHLLLQSPEIGHRRQRRVALPALPGPLGDLLLLLSEWGLQASTSMRAGCLQGLRGTRQWCWYAAGVGLHMGRATLRIVFAVAEPKCRILMQRLPLTQATHTSSVVIQLPCTARPGCRTCWERLCGGAPKARHATASAASRKKNARKPASKVPVTSFTTPNGSGPSADPSTMQV